MSLVKIQGNASGTGTLTIAAPNTNSDYTLTLPTNTGTITTTASTPTFTGAVTAPSFIPNGSSAPTNGLYLPAANAVGIATNSTNAVYIDSSQNVGVGTSAPTAKMDIFQSTVGTYFLGGGGDNKARQLAITSSTVTNSGDTHTFNAQSQTGNLIFSTNSTERVRITSGGYVLAGKTAVGSATVGAELGGNLNWIANTLSGDVPFMANRLTNDGDLFLFRQDTVTEGTISVSGTTVSYNGGNLARYAQTQAPKDDTIVKGTVLSNLDEMSVYINPETGEPVPNEQLNKVKVSDVEGDVNVAGVFVNWHYDDQHLVDEINMAMTGDMIIRIAQGVVVQKGDLLMSAGDGTAKPQGDDIVRSKTVAKVTSNHVTCTYEDGSYCVPCVLMAC